MKKINRYILWLALFLLFVGGVVFLSSDTVEIIPPNAVVYLERKTMEYYSPQYLENLVPSFKIPDKKLGELSEFAGRFLAKSLISEMGFVQTTVKEAKAEGARPNPNCRDAGHFVGIKQNTFLHYLSQFGLRSKSEKRWDNDGNWNW